MSEAEHIKEAAEILSRGCNKIGVYGEVAVHCSTVEALARDYLRLLKDCEAEIEAAREEGRESQLNMDCSYVCDEREETLREARRERKEERG